jgi:hypothetical protein
MKWDYFVDTEYTKAYFTSFVALMNIWKTNCNHSQSWVLYVVGSEARKHILQEILEHGKK